MRLPGAGCSAFRFCWSAGSRRSRFLRHSRWNPPASTPSTRRIPGWRRCSSPSVAAYYQPHVAGRAALAAAGGGAGLGGGLRPRAASLLLMAHGSSTLRFPPCRDDRAAGGLAGLLALALLGLVAIHAMGRRPRTSPSPASRTWWAISIWAIFLSLGFFTAWALVSWPLSIAPLLVLLENRSALSALGQSLQAGQGVHRQAGRDQPGDGHCEAGAALCWRWCFPPRRCPSAMSWARAPCTVVCGRFGGLLSCRQRLLPGGAAEGVYGVLESFQRTAGRRKGNLANLPSHAPHEV